MLTRFIRIQLVLFAILTVLALVLLGWYYLRLPTVMGIGQYTLKATLPASGGLYPTANVTYRGITIGKVIKVDPTESGAQAEVSIDNRYKIPVDASANVHSVSAIGEQYLDLVSSTNSHQYLSDGQTITKSTVPSQIGPALDTAYRGLAVLPKEQLASVLHETSQAVGGLGPALQRLVDATQAIVGGLNTNLADVDAIVDNSAPIIGSQVDTGDAIERWARNLNTLTRQTADNDKTVRNVLGNAAPTVNALAAVLSNVKDSLPQTVANVEVVLDMLKRYHSGLEQSLVVLPQGAAIAQTVNTAYPGMSALNLGLTINQPPPCMTGFVPASQWRAAADTSTAPLPSGTYCKIPMDTPSNVVRGARNYPCADVPGKRAATPAECRSNAPYVPAGTNPWYGDPNQVLDCPAQAGRCDQGVKPGRVFPAPSVNTGLNPLPANQVPGPLPPVSDPLTPPGQGSVTCNYQQPNPCTYTPSPGPSAVYSPSSGQLMTPDGVKYTVDNSSNTGDDGWKEMLAPAS